MPNDQRAAKRAGEPAVHVRGETLTGRPCGGPAPSAAKMRRAAGVGLIVALICAGIGACIGGAFQLNHPHGPEALVGALVGLGIGLFCGAFSAACYMDVSS